MVFRQLITLSTRICIMVAWWGISESWESVYSEHVGLLCPVDALRDDSGTSSLSGRSSRKSSFYRDVNRSSEYDPETL